MLLIYKRVMSACPLTPPRQKHLRSGHGPILCLGPSTPDKTPARSSTITPKSTAFKTPVSIRKSYRGIHSISGSDTLLNAGATSPTASNSYNQSITPNTQAPRASIFASHYASPEPTPRRRRKGNADDMFSLLQSDEESGSTDSASRLAFGLLIPNHSTVGSGRKVASVRPRAILQSPQEGEASAIFEPQVELDDCHSNRAGLPATPGPQVINEELVKHWYGSSYNGFSSDEDIDEIEAQRTMPPNPFITSTDNTAKDFANDPVKTSNGSNIFSGKQDAAINLDTHMELVNHRTGQRRVVKLSSRQSHIKPKKLDFSQC